MAEHRYAIANIATVNGEPICKQEFTQQLRREKALIYNYFKDKYGVEDSSTFWTDSYGGEKPLNLIRRTALKQCIRTKIQQILAKQNGIIADCTYSRFLADLGRENVRRKRAIEDKEPIYGPVVYEEGRYFDYLLSIVVINLKEKLLRKGAFSVTEEELKEYYAGAEYDPEQSFDNLKGIIKLRIIDRKYEELIDGLVRQASININHDIYRCTSFYLTGDRRREIDL